jgi:hypothetical protein
MELSEGFHRFVLSEGRLGVPPDELVEVADALGVLIDPFESGLLCFGEFS